MEKFLHIAEEGLLTVCMIFLLPLVAAVCIPLWVIGYVKISLFGK